MYSEFVSFHAKSVTTNYHRTELSDVSNKSPFNCDLKIFFQRIMQTSSLTIAYFLNLGRENLVFYSIKVFFEFFAPFKNSKQFLRKIINFVFVYFSAKFLSNLLILLLLSNMLKQKQ